MEESTDMAILLTFAYQHQLIIKDHLLHESILLNMSGAEIVSVQCPF